jgi:Mor family transcriptional regulator
LTDATDSQLDWLEQDPAFNEQLECLPELLEDSSMAEHAYQEVLWEYVTLFEHRLTREGQKPNEARELSAKLVAEMAHYLGGRPRYLPTGEKLKQELRDIAIFNASYRGKPVEHIYEQYKDELSLRQIQRIVKERTLRYRNKIQPDFNLNSPA